MIAAIVLAAGFARRMGRQKLLLDLRGKPVVRWSVEALLPHVADTVVVMTTRPGTVKQVIRVNLERPRVPQMLYSREYAELKKSAAESVHEEARRAFERGEKEQA